MTDTSFRLSEEEEMVHVSLLPAARHELGLAGK